MDDLFHKILIHLYNTNGLNIELNINEFLKQELEDKSYDNETLIKVGKVLEALNTSKYALTQPIQPLGKYNYGNSKSGHNNLDDHEINVKLELLGHNYIAEKISKIRQDNLLERQTIITEESGMSVIRTNDKFWVTIAIGLLAAGGTIWSAILTSRQLKLTEKQELNKTQLDSLKQRQNELEQTLYRLQKDEKIYQEKVSKPNTTKENELSKPHKTDQSEISTNSQQ